MVESQNSEETISIIYRIYYGKYENNNKTHGNYEDKIHKVNINDKISNIFKDAVRVDGIRLLDLDRTFKENLIKNNDIIQPASKSRFAFKVEIFNVNNELIKEVDLEASYDYSFYNVKQLIKEKTGIDESNLTLIWTGKVLDNKEHFKDKSGWQKNGVIKALFREK